VLHTHPEYGTKTFTHIKQKEEEKEVTNKCPLSENIHNYKAKCKF
jgi:hypothetical protein